MPLQKLSYLLSLLLEHVVKLPSPLFNWISTGNWSWEIWDACLPFSPLHNPSATFMLNTPTLSKYALEYITVIPLMITISIILINGNGWLQCIHLENRQLAAGDCPGIFAEMHRVRGEAIAAWSGLCQIENSHRSQWQRPWSSKAPHHWALRTRSGMDLEQAVVWSQFPGRVPRGNVAQLRISCSEAETQPT